MTKLIAMKPTKKLNAAFSIWSNSYGTSTGYGVQVTHLVDRLKRDGAEVAVLSNYGLEGRIDNIQTPYGQVAHYPRGFDAYSNDVGPVDHKIFTGKHPDKKSALITLYDVWVMTNKQYDDIERIGSWVPLDHITMPPKVKQWLVKPNVTPIAMAPHGVRQMEEQGIECEYVPHAVDTKVYKPTFQIPTGETVANYFNSKDKFVVGMVAANKAAGLVHRKAFSENLLAYSIFKKKHPDALLYLHTEPLGLAGGWNLLQLIEAVGLSKDDVIFPHPLEYRFGLESAHMAAVYTGMDVLLAPSLGEGFGVPTIEAQACGTRVIVSNWAASPDLLGDGWAVEGQPQFDAGQNAWWKIPSVPSIVEALEQAYAAGKGRSDKAVEFAKSFDVEKVWKDNWLPVLDRLTK